MVTKDADFRDSHLLTGSPARLLVVATGFARRPVPIGGVNNSSANIAPWQGGRLAGLCGAPTISRPGAETTAIRTPSSVDAALVPAGGDRP